MNVVELEEAFEALARSPFDPTEFPFRLAEAVGVSAANTARLRRGSTNRSDIAGGTLLSGKFHVVVTSADRLTQTLLAIADSNATRTRGARLAIATDGVRIVARDLKTDDTLHCAFEEIGDQFGFFLPLAGFERFSAARENPVDIRATSRLTKLYDTLLRHNPDWAKPERRHAMNQFMTRVVFCFFAEDTGIFEDDLFTRTVTDYGGARGESVQTVVEAAFRAMAVAGGREDLPAYARRFPYVNGGLFAGEISVPSFNQTAFGYLKDGGALDWREINPDIFGSMIQSIADPEMRAELGMHYTSVPNILKAIGPLFLDDIDEEIERAWSNPKALRRILDRMARIRVFDPACGSGNFLVVSYRELRERETRILRRLRELETHGQMALWSRISLSNFYGIEIADFAAETAKLGMHIAEYQANRRFEDAFGHVQAGLPLREGAHIVTGNALSTDWTNVCPPDGGPVYLVGNPPFVGSNNQTDEQKSEMKALFSKRVETYGNLDYVAAWFLKGSDYIRGRSARMAFVSTNSICQGFSVPNLWPVLLADGLEIAFAHRSFLWRNNAAAKAAVICVIVALRNTCAESKRIFDGETQQIARNINPYLIDYANVIVEPSYTTLFSLPEMLWGNKPVDDGNLILSPVEARQILETRPHANRFVKRFYGSQEITKGIERYCIWVEDADLEEALAIPEFATRFARVAAFRAASEAAETRPAAAFPHRFRQIQAAGPQAIIVPGVTSETRPYLAVDVVRDAIVSNLAMAIYTDEIWPLALIASRLHLLWIETVCGRLKSDYRYSNVLGWNTFPVPALSADDIANLDRSARAILLARAAHHPATFGQLYDRNSMPDDLRAAHAANDLLVERLYGADPFTTDRARLEHLFGRYVERVARRAAAE